MNPDNTKYLEGANPLEFRGTLRSLLSELQSFEDGPSLETIRRVESISRSLSTLKRIPQARQIFGSVIDPIFFERQARFGMVRRSPQNVQHFIHGVLPSQFL